ncbi:MAG: proline--tRNA ligase, partial [Candidatus Kapaibacterium sp.]
NFAKAFDVQFSNAQNQLEHVWATSWGVSTRLVGALIMAHSDDDGLVLPPKLAPFQVVIVPIPTTGAEVDAAAGDLMAKLKAAGVSVKYDTDDSKRSGFKFAEYELKGIPVRVAIGKRDLENGTVEIARRDTKEKISVPMDTCVDVIRRLLDDIQEHLFRRAKSFQTDNITDVESFEEFSEVLETRGGFIRAHWDGTSATEEAIKERTKATIRCIPLDNPQEAGRCVLSGAPSPQRVLFAKAY